MATAPTLTQIQQGGTPATIGDIVNAIQNQYSPTQVGYGDQGVSYGAGRYLDSVNNNTGASTTGTVNPNITVEGSAAPSWFTPGKFDIETFRTAPTIPEVQEAIASGTLNTGGGSSDRGMTLAEQYAQRATDPYAALFNEIPGWATFAIGQVNPLMGLFVKGAQGAATTQAANILANTLEQAYNYDYDTTNPLVGAMLGLFGGKTAATQDMSTLAKEFSSPESIFGYFDVATNPVVNAIFMTQYGTAEGLTPDAIGQIGNQIVSEIHNYVAEGMPLNVAEARVALDYGLPSNPILAEYDPMGQFIADLQDPFSDAALGLSGMTYNNGGTSLGNGTIGYSDGRVVDAGTGEQVGGVVTDSQGNAVTTAEGTPVGWGVGVSPTYSGGSSGGGLTASQASEAASTGSYTNDSGQSVSNAASIAAQDAASFGDSDGGGGGGGGGSSRYCCSRMVHHGLWDVNHEFARLTIWSRKQPNWWRSGYPVWGKIVAKHLLGKVGFWTDVMQAFYDNKVRKKPRTIKSTIGELVIFPGAFVCGMIWKDIPTKATLADPKEFV